jgi:N-acetylmuramoyl-L-alanine amidase
MKKLHELIVVVDPGHGGQRNTGTLVGPINESDYVLSLGHKIHRWSKKIGWDILTVLTREGDTELTSKERGALSNIVKADLFLSLHVDWNPDNSINGLQTYYWPGNSIGLDIAWTIMRNAPSKLYREGGAPIATTKAHNWLGNARAILAYPQSPAVLTELGFASNQGDLRQLLNQNVQDSLALTILSGIARMREINNAT